MQQEHSKNGINCCEICLHYILFVVGKIFLYYIQFSIVKSITQKYSMFILLQSLHTYYKIRYWRWKKSKLTQFKSHKIHRYIKNGSISIRKLQKFNSNYKWDAKIQLIHIKPNLINSLLQKSRTKLYCCLFLPLHYMLLESIFRISSSKPGGNKKNKK